MSQRPWIGVLSFVLALVIVAVAATLTIVAFDLFGGNRLLARGLASGYFLFLKRIHDLMEPRLRRFVQASARPLEAPSLARLVAHATIRVGASYACLGLVTASVTMIILQQVMPPTAASSLPSPQLNGLAAGAGQGAGALGLLMMASMDPRPWIWAGIEYFLAISLMGAVLVMSLYLNGEWIGRSAQRATTAVSVCALSAIFAVPIGVLVGLATEVFVLVDDTRMLLPLWKEISLVFSENVLLLLGGLFAGSVVNIWLVMSFGAIRGIRYHRYYERELASVADATAQCGDAERGLDAAARAS